MGKSKRSTKSSKKSQQTSQEDTTVKSKCPLYKEAIHLTALRSFYSSNYWFIQDEALKTIAEQLVQNRFVYLNHFLPHEHAKLLLNDIVRLEDTGVFNSGYLAGN